MKVLKQGVSLFLALIMVLGMLNGFVTFADSPETEGVSVAEENQEKKDEFVVETDDGEMLVAGKEALPEENPADVEDDDKNDEEKLKKNKKFEKIYQEIELVEKIYIPEE